MISTEFSRSGQLGPRYTKDDILAGTPVAMIPCTVKGEPAMKPHAKVRGRNIVEYWTPEGDRVIRYHRTDIIKYIGGTSARIILTSNDYKTNSTKNALNLGMNPLLSVSQAGGQWFLHCRPVGRRKGWTVPFYDGMEVIDLKKPKPNRAVEEREKLLKKKIIKYVEHLGTLFVGGKSQVPLPNAGDCWACRGLFPGGTSSCMEGHMDENYVHGTLVHNAIIAANRPYPEVWWHDQKHVQRFVRNYLKFQLGIVR